MYGFLVFILVFFSIIAFVIGKFVFNVYKIIHKTKKTAEEFAKNMNNGNPGGFDSKDYTGGKEKQTSGNDDVIIDTRNPDVSKRKIFSPKEGEYVKFEEES